MTIAAGADSAGQLAHDTGLALAERLGVAVEIFPGGHAGFLTHPAPFAERLRRVLR
jgi:pimeloyl-ACP methyl ester carboxylesterase